MPSLESIRIDKWLWTARFFKTRKLASEAVSGGRVHMNGQRCKPSKDVKLATELSITKGSLQWNIVITGINAQRRPAKEAILLYEEEQASINSRQEKILLEKQQRALLPFSEQEHKPNKKQRRQIHRFKQG
jgi:ribosome-associated heat shock protein Hsp15